MKRLELPPRDRLGVRLCDDERAGSCGRGLHGAQNLTSMPWGQFISSHLLVSVISRALIQGVCHASMEDWEVLREFLRPVTDSILGRRVPNAKVGFSTRTNTSWTRSSA